MLFRSTFLHPSFARLSMGSTTKGKAMSGDTDLIKLYSARILELAADIPHHARLEASAMTDRKSVV